MNKYIDADKLKKLIDEKWKELADKNVKVGGGKWDAEISTYLSIKNLITSLQQKQDVDLEKFTQKMDDWKARYNHPDNIPIKATMAFTARMFYMYPDVAMEWYDGLSKATQD